ncbi:MAG: MotA/TolQ/ExbB proton channel family protein [Tepidisphaerales bacterium]
MAGLRTGGYGGGPLRLALLVTMAVVAVWWMADVPGGDAQAQPMALAQATPPGPVGGGVGTAAPTPAPRQGILSIIPFDFVTVIIVGLSFVAVTLIIQGFIKTRASVFMPESSVQAIRDMIQNRQFRELIEFTERDPSFVSQALGPALRRAPSFSAMKEALETSVGEQTANAFRKIEYLNVIGNLGPLLGLLGTTMGMIVAFDQMRAAGGAANPAQLAEGISIALAHTFMGLALAIPCLGAFGVLRTLTDRLTVEAALKAEELLLLTKPAEPAVAPVAVRATPPPPAAVSAMSGGSGPGGSGVVAATPVAPSPR